MNAPAVDVAARREDLALEGDVAWYLNLFGLAHYLRAALQQVEVTPVVGELDVHRATVGRLQLPEDPAQKSGMRRVVGKAIERHHEIGRVLENVGSDEPP